MAAIPQDNQSAAETDDLLARAVQQDPAAFDDLYRRYLPQVYRYLLARVGNEQVAQDLTAQTFLAALEHIAQYRGPGTFAGWLLRIAAHKAADHFRRAPHTVPLQAVLEVADNGPPLEQIVGDQLQLEQVLDALQLLPAERAEALTLRVFGGLSTAEVARAMERSEAAVKMLVHRAIRDLQRHLRHDAASER